MQCTNGNFRRCPELSRRPTFTAAGFRTTVISEPEPDPAAHELFPEELAAKPRFLCFLFFVLQADRTVVDVHGGITAGR